VDPAEEPEAFELQEPATTEAAQAGAGGGDGWGGTMRELIVDNFAGGGGASTGIELALGRSPDYAINHDAVALAMHAANHPDTVHLQNNVWKIDPDAIDGPIGLAWFSPDCKHFSKAKGGKPVEKGIRDLAWVVVRWARRRAGGPRVIILENVEEFSTWGPLGADGRPCPERKGATFKRWTGELRRLGYKVEWRELRACDYGAPTIRKRLFLIARRDGEAIVWPQPTHGAPDSVGVRSGALQPWRTAAEIIDWSLPCPSIFDTAEEIMARYGLRAVRPLQPATLARIAKGVKRYVLDAAKPFVVNLTHHGEGQMQDIADPLATVTAAHRGEKAMVMPFVSAAQQGGSVRPVDDPLHTVTASRKDQNQIVVPTLSQTGYGEREGQEPRVPGLEKPLGTAVAGGIKHAVIAPHLMTMRNAGKPFNEADRPAHTVTSGGAHMHLVAAFLAKHFGGNETPGWPADKPISTVTAQDHHALIAANLLRQFGTGVGSSLDEPARTVMADGAGKTQLSAAFLSKYYGTGDGQVPDDPMHTVTTKDRLSLVTVTIDGEPYVITDIGMRMLTPRELFRAQGFPDSYIIDRGADGAPITKTQQVAKCGNSVCPPMAAALVRANYAPREIAAPEPAGAFFLEAAE
jgi:DNA (cytosine-5)-methyltransferase 1